MAATPGCNFRRRTASKGWQGSRACILHSPHSGVLLSSSTPTGPTSSGEPVNTGDQRPNSGLREGDISHAEVNEALRRVPKTIIFGQHNRLRDGLLMEEDERLDRFHAGHDLVRFFYDGVRQLPDYLTDALLANGVSITLVNSDDLLVFHHCRRHQSFHTGRTRKTIYMPQLAIHEARLRLLGDLRSHH
jgi:hypothetical protein